MILTVGAQQQRSGPQTSEQLALAAVGFHLELVRVAGLADPLRLLHPDSKRRSSVISLVCPVQDKIYSQAYHVTLCPCVRVFPHTCQLFLVHYSERKDRKTLTA